MHSTQKITHIKPKNIKSKNTKSNSVNRYLVRDLVTASSVSTLPSTVITFLLGVVLLSGCQSTVLHTPQVNTKNLPSQPAIITNGLPNKKTPNGTAIESGKPKEQTNQSNAEKRKQQQIELAEKQAQQRAKRIAEAKRQANMRQTIINKQKRTNKNTNVRIKDGKNLPAFNRLMKSGVQNLKQNKLSTAKQNFIAAQRLAPQSPAVYLYLSDIALRQKQATKAEMLARRGLSVSRSNRYDISLWKRIYFSAKMRNNTSLMQQARQKINQLNALN